MDFLLLSVENVNINNTIFRRSDPHSIKTIVARKNKVNGLEHTIFGG